MLRYWYRENLVDSKEIEGYEGI